MTRKIEYDVIIVGGGAAGVGAAVGARQADPTSKILIIESEACLGGAATHRGVLSYCGLFTCTQDSKRAVGRIWDDLRARLLELGATDPDPVRHRGVFQVVEPEGLKVALDDMMTDHKIEVLLHAPVARAERSAGGEVLSVEIQEKVGRRVIYGKAFVDCSGDCDLAFFAGASTRYGNDGVVNLGSLSTRWGGLCNASPTAQQWREAVQAAKAADPQLENRIPKDGSVLIRFPLSGDICSYMASAVYDARSATSITRAEQAGRKQAQEYLKILRKLPGHEKMYLVATGPSFGTRESRHIEAKYQLKESDISSQKRFADTIAIGGWGLEWHDSADKSWSSTFTLPPDGSFEIPLSSLWSENTANLFAAGRCVDGDRLAGGAVRVMGTALATGQAAGVAAALWAQGRHREDELADAVREVPKVRGRFLIGINFQITSF